MGGNGHDFKGEKNPNFKTGSAMSPCLGKGIYNATGNTEKAEGLIHEWREQAVEGTKSTLLEMDAGNSDASINNG